MALGGPLPPAVPPLLTLLAGLVGPFHRPRLAPNEVLLLVGASTVGALYGSSSEERSPLPEPGAVVAVEGWVEAELDGGAVLHVGGHSIPIRPGTVSDGELQSHSGRAVRLRGVVAEPWHPRSHPSIVARSVYEWRDGGVNAAGVPPLARAWMRFRLSAREEMRRRIRRLWPEHAGVAGALLLADRSALDPEVRESFVRAGVAHLLAISGFHVGILAAWIFVALGSLQMPHRARSPAAAALVWLYVALLGFPTSAVRAALLVTAVAAGRARGRPVHGLGAWGAALAFVAVVDPIELRSGGAQLSFAGSLGLLLWARRWGELLGGDVTHGLARWPDRVRRVLGTAVGASAAAQLATLPFVIWHFQRIPLSGLPASVIATPIVGAALPGIVLALVAEGVAPLVSLVLASGAEALLSTTVGVVGVFSSLGGAAWAGPLQLLGAAVGAAMGATAAPRSRHGRARRGAVGALVGVVLAPMALAVASTGTTELHVLDVGQGDAIAIRSPGGRWVLVDAGPGESDALFRQLARRGVTRLEALVLTHPDLDHIGGAADVLRELPVGRVVGPGLLRGTPALRSAVVAAEARGVPWATVAQGDALEVDGVELSVVHAGGAAITPNDHSIVLHLRFGAFDALLTGDVSSSIEDQLPARLPRGTDVEVLKVAHHGSETSSSEVFLDALTPEVALISAGRWNRFGHPARLVLERFRARGIPVARTDRSGTLRVRARADGGFEIAVEFGEPFD